MFSTQNARENGMLRTKNNNLETQFNHTKKYVEDLEGKELKLQATINSLKKKVSPQC